VENESFDLNILAQQGQKPDVSLETFGLYERTGRKRWIIGQAEVFKTDADTVPEIDFNILDLNLASNSFLGLLDEIFAIALNL
jgi:hypothetical protein